MTMQWNPLVNKNLNLEGDYGLREDNIVTLQFASGKERKYLKNSFTPMEYPSLSLELDNNEKTKNGRTELEEFQYWHSVTLRYGILQFYFPRIGNPNQTGIYEFMSMPKYSDTDGIVTAEFGLRETAVI